MINLLEIVVGESAVAFTLSAFHLFSLHSFPCINTYKIVSFTQFESHKFHVFYHPSRSLHIFLKSSFHRLQPHNHKLSFLNLILHNTCKVLYRFQGSFALQMRIKNLFHTYLYSALAEISTQLFKAKSNHGDKENRSHNICLIDCSIICIP